MAGLAPSGEQVEKYLYVISHLTMMQEYELLRCDRAARVTCSSHVSSPNMPELTQLVRVGENILLQYSHLMMMQR